MNLIKFPVRDTALNVIECEWFIGKETIGIILCEHDYTRVTSAYMGMSTSNDPQTSAEHIVRNGTTLPKQVVESIFGFQPFFKN